VNPDEAGYPEMSSYTLSKGDASFMHQYLVDACAIHSATPASRPIVVTQALIGSISTSSMGSPAVRCSGFTSWWPTSGLRGRYSGSRTTADRCL
jgi:hypothetical protein